MTTRVRASAGLGLLFAVTLGGCGGSDSESGDAATGEERRLAEMARPFMEAVTKHDHEAAYRLLSSHLTRSLTLEQFRIDNESAFAELGRPLALGEVYGVETDPKILVGPEHATGEGALDQAASKLQAADAVGAMPDSIPLAIRRASVKGRMVIGKDESGDELAYLLTVVLVEDAGRLRVGHYFFRPYNIFD